MLRRVERPFGPQPHGKGRTRNVGRRRIERGSRGGLPERLEVAVGLVQLFGEGLYVTREVRRYLCSVALNGEEALPVAIGNRSHGVNAPELNRNLVRFSGRHSRSLRKRGPDRIQPPVAERVDQGLPKRRPLIYNEARPSDVRLIRDEALQMLCKTRGRVNLLPMANVIEAILRVLVAFFFRLLKQCERDIEPIVVTGSGIDAEEECVGHNATENW